MKLRKISLLMAILMMVGSLAACGTGHNSENNAADIVSSMSFTDNIETGCVAEKYTMDITLDTENNTVHGTSVVNLKNTTDNTLNEVCFRLYSANISSGEISEACNNSTETEYEIDVKKDPSVIYLSLGDDAVQPGDTLELRLNFESEIPLAADRFGCASYDNGNLYNLSFCFPQVAFLEDGTWFEEKYRDDSESYYYSMSDYDVTLSAPTDYVVLSSGKSETKNGKTTISAPNVREMAISACNFAQVKTVESNGITYNLLTPDYDNLSDDYLKDLYDMMMTVAVESTEMYSENVGEYIYDEIDIIPALFKGFGGMEFPGLVQIGIPTGKFDLTGSFSATATAHEIGHQWFYCALSNDTSTEPWLDESFTSYLEQYYWINSVDGRESVENLNEKYTKGFDVYLEPSFAQDEYENRKYINFPLSNYGFFSLNVIYENGSWFLRELEIEMGKEAFFEMLSDWYNSNTSQIVTGREFLQHLLEYDSSDQVKAIINEYISEEKL